MKIVIDIPDKKWELIQNNEYCGIIDDLLFQNIQNGTPLAEVIEDIKKEIRARVFDIQATSDKYFDGVDDVMDIVDSVIDKHISGKENKDADSD